MSNNILEALNESLVSINQKKLKPCTHCGENRFYIRKTVNNGGGVCFPYFCASCGNRSPICERKEIAKIVGFVE